jgi:hypothetical protein
MSDLSWLIFGANAFTALACLVFLLTYSTRASGFHDALGRTLIAIKAGIFGMTTLLAANVLVDIDVITVRWIFSLLVVQIGFAVLWQTWTIFQVNKRGTDDTRRDDR